MSNARTTTARVGTPRARQPKPPPPKIRFRGGEYRIADEVGIWPLMQMARAAQSGVSLADQRGLAAAHALLQDVIHPDDWGQFEEDMIIKKVNDLEALMAAVGEATALVQARAAKKTGRANGTAAIEN